MTERYRARPQTAKAQISNPVAEGQCHLLHLRILGRFSWPSLAYISAQSMQGFWGEPQDFLASLGDFLKNLAPPAPPPLDPRLPSMY